MAVACKFPWWPMVPFFGAGVPVVLLVLLTIAGAVFSLVMLIDCLKRPASKFLNPLTKKGEHDKLIWAGAIVASFWFYFLGAIVYFFIVMKATPESGEK